MKSLAAQTTRATDEISVQVQDIQTATQAAVDGIRFVTKAIGDVETISSDIASAVDEQNRATDEIVSSVSRASESTELVGDAISDVLAAASDTGSASELLAETAGTVSERASAISLEVDTFLRTVRSETG